MTHDELLALPPILDVPTAAKVLGIGRSLAYDLVRRDQWPSTVLHVGKLIKIPTEPLIRLLQASVDTGDHNHSAGGPGTPSAAGRQRLQRGV